MTRRIKRRMVGTAFHSQRATRLWAKVGRWLGLVGLTGGLVGLLGQRSGPLLGLALMGLEDLGPLGGLGFIALYNLATVCCVPASVLMLGGGAIYGVGWGSVYGVGAALLGATVAFLIGRYGARRWVGRHLSHHPQLYAQFQALDLAVTRSGLKIVLLSRLSPLLPFNLLNYAFGLTRISLRDYVLGSLGLIPGTVVYVYVGSLAGELATLDSSTTMTSGLGWAIRVGGLAATVAMMYWTAQVAQAALRDAAPPAPESGVRLSPVSPPS